MVIYVVLACVLRATTKKGRQLFRGEKCTPRENGGYAYASWTVTTKDGHY